MLEGSATEFIDRAVEIGRTYEYGFYKTRRVICDTLQVPGGTPLTFTIFDSFGDGICCHNGLGYFEVTGCDTTYASGSDYGGSDATSFVAECEDLVVFIAPDIFRQELSWTLVDDLTGETLASGGSYRPLQYGHILAGIEVPVCEDRGTVLLLVDDNLAGRPLLR